MRLDHSRRTRSGVEDVHQPGLPILPLQSLRGCLTTRAKKGSLSRGPTVGHRPYVTVGSLSMATYPVLSPRDALIAPRWVHPSSLCSPGNKQEMLTCFWDRAYMTPKRIYILLGVRPCGAKSAGSTDTSSWISETGRHAPRQEQAEVPATGTALESSRQIGAGHGGLETAASPSRRRAHCPAIPSSGEAASSRASPVSTWLAARFSCERRTWRSTCSISPERVGIFGRPRIGVGRLASAAVSLCRVTTGGSARAPILATMRTDRMVFRGTR